MQQETKKKQKIICITMLFLFSLVLFSIVPSFRLKEYAGWPYGSESYYHMRIAEYILKEGIPEKDPNTILPIRYAFDPFQIVLGLVGKAFGMKNTAIMLPVLLGLGTIFFLYALLAIVFPIFKQRLLATIFIAASPIFLTIFSQVSNIAWIIFLIAAGFWCFLRDDKLQWLSLLFFPLLFFYDPFHTMIAMLLLLYVGWEQKKRKKLYFLWSILGMGLLWIIWTKKIVVSIKIIGFLELLQVLLADLGAVLGMSLFGIILGAIGLSYLSQERKITWKECGLFLFLLLLTLFRSNEFAVYLNIGVAILAARGFLELAKKEWKLQDLRKITLFLLLLGIVYSGTTTVARHAIEFPDAETMQALQWLETESDENATLLTAPEYGFVVEQATKRMVLLDENGLAIEEGQRLQKQIETVFHARQKETALDILEQYQVDYILIFEEMTAGKVWNKKDEGLLFILEHEKNFKRVFENNKVIIWRVRY